MKKIFTLITFILLTSSVFSQKEYHNWVFGIGSYITFDTLDGEPIFVDSLSITVSENSSVISNNNAELQYYSFENYLYNSSEEIINSTVDGHASSMQGSSMLRIDDNHYVRVGSNYSRDNTPENSVLSFIDIVKNGNTETVSENKIIDSNFTSEGLLVIKNKSNDNIYIVVSDTSGAVKSELNLYKYENNRFELKQSLPQEHNYPFHFIKHSPFNNIIVGTNLDTNKMHFYRFNPELEIVETLKANSELTTDNNASYVEFSPNGEYLYVASSFDFYRYEGFNSIEREELRLNSIYNIQGTGDLGQLLLAPNGKIYISRNGASFLASIENPNSRTNSIGFVPESVNLNNTRSIIGLPNIPTSYYYSNIVRDSLTICNGSTILLEAGRDFKFLDLTYSWVGPNGFSSNEANTAVLNSEIKHDGLYILKVFNSDRNLVYTKEVVVKVTEDLEIEIIGSDICKGGNTTLEALPNDPSYTYEWNNGETTQSIDVSQPDTYTVTVIKEGCSGTAEFTVNENSNPEFEITGEDIACDKPTKLSANKDFEDYLWSTNETTKEMEVTNPGTYSLTVTDTNGCQATKEFTVNLVPISFEILGKDVICDTPIKLTSNKEFEEYLWSTNETTREIEVTNPGTYSLTVTDRNGCQATEEFVVTESPNSEFEIIGEDIVCGNTVTLSPDKDFPEYLWSTDETTKDIEVSEAGTYSLTITDENGCQVTEEFTVNLVPLSFDISKDRIDFGKVYISETATDAATIINTSGIDIELSDGQIIGDGMPISFDKTLDPTELGAYTDSFEYRVISPCDTVITIPVTAEVYAKVEISSDNIETEIGKEEIISVYLEAEADLGEQTYSITTGIDQSVLYTNNNYTFTNTAPITEAKTKIHEINGMIMLASELEYDISFPSYEFNNPYIEVTTEQGKLTIDSVCAFPMRSVTITEATEMKVSPNPAKDKLVVDVSTGISTGSMHRVSTTLNEPEMKLELISSEGRVAYTEQWTQTTSNKQLNINTGKIPSGLYQIRLQTPSGILTENVIVVR